jgi:hypothetical protein
MEAIWRRLNDVNLILPEKLVVLMTLMGLSHLSELEEEFWNLKGPFHEDYQERSATRSCKTREDSHRRKREKVWCKHCSRFVTTHFSELLEQT